MSEISITMFQQIQTDQERFTVRFWSTNDKKVKKDQKWTTFG